MASSQQDCSVHHNSVSAHLGASGLGDHGGHIAPAVLGLLLAAYLLAFGGKLHVIDEYSALSMTASLANGGHLYTGQMAWAYNGDFSQDAFGRGGWLYSKKAIGIALWTVPFYGLGKALNTGTLGAGLLSSAVAAASGGVAIYALGAFLSRSAKVGVALALLYGFGTMVFVYSRVFFGEGAATMGMAIATAGLAIALKSDASRHRRQFVLAGLGLAISLLARLPSALALPPALLVTAWQRWKRGGRLGELSRDLLALSMPPGLALLLVGLANLERFGSPLRTGYTAAESFRTPLLVGLKGLLISPGKSLFLYSPPLLLSLIAFPKALRRWPALVFFCLSSSAAQVLVYARWHAWDGGWSWGPRFLLPVVPLFMPLVVPALEGAQQGRKALAFSVWGLSVLGLLFNIGGSAIDFTAFYGHLILQGVTHYVDGYNHALGHLAMLNPFRPHLEMLDLAWARFTDGRVVVAWLPMVLALVATIGCSHALIHGLKGESMPVVMPLSLTALAFLGSLLSYQGALPDRQLAKAADALRAVGRLAKPGDVLIVEIPTYLSAYQEMSVLLDVYGGPAPVVVVQRRHQEPSLGEMRLLSARLGDPRRLWLSLTDTLPGDPDSTTERWLGERAYLARQMWTSGSSRVDVFYPPPATVDAVAHGTGGQLGSSIALSEFTVAVRDAGLGESGSILLVHLTWVASSRPAGRYKVFVQLIGPDERLVAQVDAEPLGGLAPTDAWQAGEVVEDRYAVAVPQRAAGQYRLIAGMYDATTGRRVRAAAGEDCLYLAQLTLN